MLIRDVEPDFVDEDNIPPQPVTRRQNLFWWAALIFVVIGPIEISRLLSH